MHGPAGWPWPITAPSWLLTNVIEVGWKSPATVAPARCWLSDDGLNVTDVLDDGCGRGETEEDSRCGAGEEAGAPDGVAVVGVLPAARLSCPGEWPPPWLVSELMMAGADTPPTMTTASAAAEASAWRALRCRARPRTRSNVPGAGGRSSDVLVQPAIEFVVVRISHRRFLLPTSVWRARGTGRP